MMSGEYVGKDFTGGAHYMGSMLGAGSGMVDLPTRLDMRILTSGIADPILEFCGIFSDIVP
jgi:hypothetical protein